MLFRRSLSRNYLRRLSKCVGKQARRWVCGQVGGLLFGFATEANRERICLANKFQRRTDI